MIAKLKLHLGESTLWPPKVVVSKQVFLHLIFLIYVDITSWIMHLQLMLRFEDHDSPSDISFLIDRRTKGCATFEAIWILWLQQHLAGFDVCWEVGRQGVHPFLLHYILGVQ